MWTHYWSNILSDINNKYSILALALDPLTYEARHALERAPGVQHKTLISGPRGCGPAVPTAISRWRLQRSSAH